MKLYRPTLLLDRNKCLGNLHSMVMRAGASKVRFRPHFKTHQSKIIGHWFRDAGIKDITVSSVSMARYFAEDGWNDITIALPLNINEIDILNSLDPGIKINVLISAVETAEQLAKQAKRPLSVYIKIDAGFHRCGFTPSNTGEISLVFEVCRRNSLLTPRGFLAHFGNTYQARGIDQIYKIYDDSIQQLKAVKEHFSPEFPGLEISVGDTPSCSLLSDFTDVTEIRPGNFIFYDIMQEQIGSCSFDQIAIGLACPVIDVHAEKNEAVIYGGAVHLSKDFIIDKQGNKSFGLLAILENDNWSTPLEGCYVKSLSQEHGILHLSNENIKHFKPGNWIVILPAHSCLTADAMGYYVTLEGKRIEMMDKRK